MLPKSCRQIIIAQFLRTSSVGIRFFSQETAVTKAMLRKTPRKNNELKESTTCTPTESLAERDATRSSSAGVVGRTALPPDPGTNSSN
jgi:hypothetical protein